MGRTIAYVGVPTRLGSYSPGQEKAPQAFRDAGFPEMLRQDGALVPSSLGSARDLIRDGIYECPCHYCRLVILWRGAATGPERGLLSPMSSARFPVAATIYCDNQPARKLMGEKVP